MRKPSSSSSAFLRVAYRLRFMHMRKMSDEAAAFWTAFFPSARASGRRFIPGHREVLMPNALSAVEIRRWIETISRNLDVSPTTWAKKAGLAPSTVNRFLKDPGAANLSARTLEALTEAHLELSLEKSKTRVTRLRDVRYRYSFNVEVISSIVTSVATSFEWDEEFEYTLKIPVPNAFIYPNYFAFEIGAGLSFPNLREGDVVAGVPLEPFRKSLLGGQLVLLHERMGSGMVRTTLRKLVTAPDGEAWLVKYGKEDFGPAINLEELGAEGFDDVFFASFLIFGVATVAPGVDWT